jgi:tRNA-2-methylthio-N6-dimethylallyladenosine synthase
LVQRRFLEVLRAVELNAFARNQRKVGSLEDVYVRHGSTEDGKAIGETWSGHAVHVRTDAGPGEYVKARVESAGPHVLYAERV